VKAVKAMHGLPVSCRAIILTILFTGTMSFDAKRIRINQGDVDIAGRNTDCFIINFNDDPGELPSHVDLEISTRPEQHHIDTLPGCPDIRVPLLSDQD